MEQLRQYLIAVTAAAIICGIVKSISSEKTPSGSMLRILAGIMMTLTVISPLVDLELDQLPALTDGLVSQADEAAAIGAEMANAEMNAIISGRVQAYILDKAAMFGATLQVEVAMPTDGTHHPEGVILSGNISPYGRARLETIIEDELQIAKEKQQWIG